MRRIRLTMFAVSVAMLVATLSVNGATQQEQDWGEVLRIVIPSAKAGDAEAQFNLGVMYTAGLGVPKDDIEALFWYRSAAEQGHAGAQYALGASYTAGDVLPQDHELAVRWFQSAAAQGHAAAQNALAGKHYRGLGVQQSYEMAAFWWRLAAEQGDVDAMHNLGNIYYLARGVPKDDVQAYMWHAIAARESVGADREEHIQSYTDIAERGMTPDQITAAQKLASEWEPASAQR
ncbi:MAG: tetratricopeptide repeat protein [Acidobacteria bacterium]|nr:tetratricopeptide repeat protein [Acidobacteriota bacterium]